MYRIVYLTGPNQGRRVTVRQGDVLIGAEKSCHVRLRHLTVLDQHAMLEERADGAYVRALYAGGEVRVNGEVVREKRLNHGDEIRIGKERLLFQHPEGAIRTQKRRKSKFHGVTSLLVASLLLAQIAVLLALLMYWRLDPIDDAGEEEQRLANRQAVLEQDLSRLAEENRRAMTNDSFRLIPRRLVTPDYVRPEAKSDDALGK